MSNSDKHKSLNKDEFFEWLDKLGNQDDLTAEASTNSLPGDDFDQEALEGILNNIDSKKLTSIDNELSAKISERVQESSQDTSKKRIIWFSAAAVIALVFGISVYFTNHTITHVNSEIAQNNDIRKENTIEEIDTTHLPLTEQNYTEPLKNDNTILSKAPVNHHKIALNESKLKDAEQENNFHKNKESVNDKETVYNDEIDSKTTESLNFAGTAPVMQDMATTASFEVATTTTVAKEKVKTESTAKKALASVPGENNSSKNNGKSDADSDKYTNSLFYKGGINQLKLDISSFTSIKLDSLEIIGEINSDNQFNSKQINTFPKAPKSTEKEIVKFLETSKKWLYSGSTKQQNLNFVLKFNP